jgi:hypothetical protein
LTLTKLSPFWYNDSGDAGTGATTLARSTTTVDCRRPVRGWLSRCVRFDDGKDSLMTDFGFQPGILDYWMLLSDWRNGSFAILIGLSVLFLGYTLVSSHKNPGGEGTKWD